MDRLIQMGEISLKIHGKDHGKNRFNHKRWEFRLGPIKNGDRSEDNCFSLFYNSLKKISISGLLFKH